MSKNVPNERHGHTGTLTHMSWRTMIARCECPTNKDFHRYGAKGISVDPRWRESFSAFLADVGPRPSAEYSLDRFPDPNGNYAPGNVRWATSLQQNNNRRNNRRLTMNGETRTLAEWCRLLGTCPNRTLGRLRQGWSDEDALLRPCRAYGLGLGHR